MGTKVVGLEKRADGAWDVRTRDASGVERIRHHLLFAVHFREVDRDRQAAHQRYHRHDSHKSIVAAPVAAELTPKFMHDLQRPPPADSRLTPAFHKTLKDGFGKPLYCLVDASPTANQCKPAAPIRSKANALSGQGVRSLAIS